MAVPGGRLEGCRWWHRESRKASWRQCRKGAGLVRHGGSTRFQKYHLHLLPPPPQEERTSAPCGVGGSAGAAPGALEGKVEEMPDSSQRLRSSVCSSTPAAKAQGREGVKGAVPTSPILVRGVFSYRKAAPLQNSFKSFRVPIRLLILPFSTAAGGCVWFVCNQS